MEERMRRDVLAAGAHKAQFAQGTGETDYSRNLYKGPEEEATVVDSAPAPAKKREFTPLGKTILVRRAEAKTPSGVLIPDSVQQDKPAEGQVLAVGVEAYKFVSVGQDIAFGRYAGAEFPLNGETLLLMNVDEVLGTFQESPQSDA
jgi:chaperonin GroES